jgi:aconitate hydratase
LKYRSNIPKYAEYVFENVDADFSKRTLENKKKGIFTAIAAGLSFGQGSSREHAAICPMYLGVRVVFAKSFERILSANLINFGILPLVFKNPDDYDKISFNESFKLKNLRSSVEGSDIVAAEINGKNFEFIFSASARQRKILLAGGMLNYTKGVF